MVKPAKLTQDSGCLDRDEFLFIIEGNQMLIYIFLYFCTVGRYNANICHSETPDKESIAGVAKFYKIDSEILEAEQKIYVKFQSCARIRLHDCFRNAEENERE